MSTATAPFISAGHHMGWEIAVEDGEFWIVGRPDLFPDSFSTLAAAVAAIEAHGKTLADTAF